MSNKLFLRQKRKKDSLIENYSLDKTEKKKKISYIDKLFYRIFLSALLLLLLSLYQTLKIKKNKLLADVFTTEINFLEVSNRINKLFNIDIFNKGDKTVYSVSKYDEVKYIDQINYVTNYSYSGVESLTDGLVVKIEKENGCYNVYIRTVDNYFYIYKSLESIDVNIYQFIKSDEIIGKAPYIGEIYKFELIIEKDSVYYSYFEQAND